MLLSIAAMPLPGQTWEEVERNIQLLREIAPFHEGFEVASEGASLVYSSYRPEPMKALLSRASTGTMAIAWKTPKVLTSAAEGDLTFVVMAGVYGQEPTGFTFHMSVNGVPRFTFSTTTAERWEVSGKGGGKLRFIGVKKDTYGDRFGCLGITLPRSWVSPGEQVHFRVVGEKANHSAWFMVFEAPDVVRYQQELVENEAYCEMGISGSGEGRTIIVRGPSLWKGRELMLSLAAGFSKSVSMEIQDGTSQAVFRMSGAQLRAPLRTPHRGRTCRLIDSGFLAILV